MRHDSTEPGICQLRSKIDWGLVKVLWLRMKDMDSLFRGGEDALQRLVMPTEAGFQSIWGSWQLTLTEP